MKEYKNLKDLKQNNVLVSIFIDSLEKSEMLEETFYSISKQTFPVDFLVFHDLNKEDETKLEKMLKSPKIILHQNKEGKLTEEVQESDGKINYVLYKHPMSKFSNLFNETFNVALNNDYEFMSIVEKYDIIGLNWFKLANEYQKENEDTGIFFPLIRNTINGVFNGLMNEAPWAEGLVEEAGKVDLGLLNRFNCMLPIGAVYRISAILEYSEQKEKYYYPFKESFEISHYYEFFLRMIYEDVESISIPRINYEIRVEGQPKKYNRVSCKIPPNLSVIPTENGGYTQQEIQFWLELAKKEYFYQTDRNETFQKTDKK